MHALIQTLAVVAILANAVIYGTDVFCAVVLRSALAQVDDAVLTSAMGQVHRFGDRRMSTPGIIGLVASVLTVVFAAIDGRTAGAVAAAVAVLALIAWLAVYNKVSVPVNKQLTSAAQEGRTAPDARSLQSTWDGVINLRVGLQTVALVALCVALAVS
ncbi:DUF1772 domain-containing protein [Streptomyces sp. NPDC051569]|uniref:DUF1772 domain-containing protein n=1 Tax=Streptomyces sp. NPDC051569 TaxID=3365661 RepID=UPI0037A468E9